MLGNIKSTYIIKYLFAFIDDRRKLKMLRYNKSVQNRIDINIMNYKRFANKYIIKEENIIKEYNIYNDELIFEGEYLNGKRNVKGKEYNSYNDKLIFKGEYLNGERNGKGNEYDKYGKLVFEGEYLNGKRWNGIGKEYFSYRKFRIRNKKWKRIYKRI